MAMTPKSTCTTDQNPDSTNGKSPSCETMITITNDNGDIDTSDCTQVLYKRKALVKDWMLHLNFAEKETLCDGRWLSDLHINAVQVWLKQQYPQIGGLQNVVLLQSSKSTKPFATSSHESLQVVPVNNNHWIVVSTLNCSTVTADITVYDSLNSSAHMETQLILLKMNKESFKIYSYVTVHAKTSLVHTKIESHFFNPAYSYIH